MSELELFVVQLVSGTTIAIIHGGAATWVSVGLLICFCSREGRFLQLDPYSGCARKTRPDYAEQHEALTVRCDFYNAAYGIVRHSILWLKARACRAVRVCGVDA